MGCPVPPPDKGLLSRLLSSCGRERKSSGTLHRGEAAIRKQFIGAVLAGMIAVFAAPSLAQTPAVTSMTVNLYAGPAGDYPVVAQLPAVARRPSMSSA
jgi:hypothetical protein